MAKRKVDARGRSKGEARHIRFYHWELGTPAFRSLTPVAKAVLIELKGRYNSLNNGQIHLSQRQAAKAIRVAVNTARAGIAELQAKGFIRINQKGSFGYKARHATTWVLTEYPYNGQLPSKDFARLTDDGLLTTVLETDTDSIKR